MQHTAVCSEFEKFVFKVVPHPFIQTGLSGPYLSQLNYIDRDATKTVYDYVCVTDCKNVAL